MNFEFWIYGKLSKSPKIWLSKSIFYVKNHPNLSRFFFIEFNLRALFSYWHFLIKSIFKSLYYQNDALFLTAPKLKTQNSIISFGYVDSYAKIFLILYPPLENSTTGIAIPGKISPLSKGGVTSSNLPFSLLNKAKIFIEPTSVISWSGPKSQSAWWQLYFAAICWK